MRNDYDLSSQRFMTELDSPETHIYISTRGYRGCLNSACEIENLEGTLREKWSCKLPLKWSTNRCWVFFKRTRQIFKNHMLSFSFHVCGRFLPFECVRCVFYLDGSCMFSLVLLCSSHLLTRTLIRHGWYWYSLVEFKRSTLCWLLDALLMTVICAINWLPEANV